MCFKQSYVYIALFLALEQTTSVKCLENNSRNLSYDSNVPVEYQPLHIDRTETLGATVNDSGFQQITRNNTLGGNSNEVFSTLCRSNASKSKMEDINETVAGQFCVNISSDGDSSDLGRMKLEFPTHHSPLFAAVAATLSAVIFVFGFMGNILVVIVIARTRSMHTPTNCYLLSLAVADSLVLLSATLPAIPEPFYRVDEWPYGRVMCSLLIFLQYLGIDSSSLSITAFTIERYIAICHPMKAQTMCTVSRAKRIIAILWIFTLLYCAPWLGLTEIIKVQVLNEDPIQKCQFRLARSSYLVVYMIDLILFYVIPLIIATLLYMLIGRILYLSRALRKSDQASKRLSPRGSTVRRADSRVQVVRMLVVVVAAFATLWMPYRVMVVYNSFAEKKYMDLWFLLFARTMVYVNCAINPVLYNIMSVKFKRAFRNHLSCWHRRFSVPSNNYSEVPTDVWATKRLTFSHPQPQSKLKHGCGSGNGSARQNCVVRQNSQARNEKQQQGIVEVNANIAVRISNQQSNRDSSIAEQAV